jgi:hypothetical protein
MSEELKPKICSYFREIEVKVPNNDRGAKDRWRFMKRLSCTHPDHATHAQATVMTGPKCRGDITNCEIPDIWKA